MFLFLKFFVLLILLSSCSDSTNVALRKEINGKGLVLLDSKNPFLAPNAFLKEEAKLSEALKGFLELKGSPESLKYERTILGTEELILIYPNKESYKLKKNSSDWIINSDVVGTNVSSSETNRTEVNRTEITNKEIVNDQINNNAESNTNKLKLSENTNNITAKEDKYHTIEFNKQSLKFISYWYTGTELNVTRIGRINSLSETEELLIGQKVRIPSYLLKREDNPTYKDLENYNSGIK